MQANYEKFPEPEDLKSKDTKFTAGMNKSGRSWKMGGRHKPTKTTLSRGPAQTWQEKKKKGEDKKILREQLREFKEKKIAKRKQLKEIRKQKKKQKIYNEIKSGKFEVIKNTKNMKKWSKKIKDQLVKLPAEVFESIINK